MLACHALGDFRWRLVPTQERVDHRAERGGIQGEVGRPRKLKKREREEIKIGKILRKPENQKKEIKRRGKGHRRTKNN